MLSSGISCRHCLWNVCLSKCMEVEHKVLRNVLLFYPPLSIEYAVAKIGDKSSVAERSNEGRQFLECNGHYPQISLARNVRQATCQLRFFYDRESRGCGAIRSVDTDLTAFVLIQSRVHSCLVSSLHSSCRTDRLAAAQTLIAPLLRSCRMEGRWGWMIQFSLIPIC